MAFWNIVGVGDAYKMAYDIKQQKHIKILFTKEFGREKGRRLFQKESEVLDTIIEQTKGKTKNQQKTLVQIILPRIAMYKAFLNEGFDKDETQKYMRKYMLEIVAAQKHSSMLKMEKVPGFFNIYKSIFLKIMLITDLQVSNQSYGRDFFDVSIEKCLWHTACVENGCEELCCLFCDVDDVTYGGLEKIGFTRTQTLGYGGNCCDFHFFRKNGCSKDSLNKN
jgi:hypothetical protein